MADVFISYRSSDRDRARKIADALEAVGYSVWWDQSLVAGNQWSRAIKAELDNANCVVVLWTENSVAVDSTYSSEWVENEAEEGKKRGVLVPALLDANRIPWTQKRLHYADLTGWDGSPDSDRLEHLFKAVAEKTPPSNVEVGEEPTTPTIRGGFGKLIGERIANAIAINTGCPRAGQSWFSVRLAASLARAKKKVVLVDVAMSRSLSSTSLLDLEPQPDLNIIEQDGMKAAARTLKLGDAHEYGFDFLPAVEGSAPRGVLSDDEFKIFAIGIPELAKNYDVVLFDMGVGVDEQTTWLTRWCRRSLVVARQGELSMVGGYANLKVVHGYAPRVEQFVAVNMAPNKISGRRTFEAMARACEHFLKFRPQLAGIVLEDTSARHINEMQALRASTDASSDTEKSISDIARAVTA